MSCARSDAARIAEKRVARALSRVACVHAARTVCDVGGSRGRGEESGEKNSSVRQPTTARFGLTRMMKMSALAME